MIKGSDRYVIFLVGLLFAAGLAYLGFPRGVAAFKALDGVRIANAVAQGKPQEPEDLRRLAVSRAQSLVWGSNPAYANELAVAYRLLSREVPPETRKSLWEAAYTASETELRAQPLNAYAWWRLGVMRSALDGATTARSASFQWHSVRVQPHAMNLVPLRLRAISDNWFQFDAGQRRDVRPQFAIAWRQDPKAVIRIAANPRRQAVIRAGLAIDPRLLGAFESALSKSP